MKKSQILREAAQLVFDGHEVYGCDAISRAGADEYASHDAGLMLWDYFWDTSRAGMPPNAESVWFWGHEPRSEERIIGLCLLAAIAKSDGD